MATAPFNPFAHLPLPDFAQDAARQPRPAAVPLFVNLPIFTDEDVERALEQELAA